MWREGWGRARAATIAAIIVSAGWRWVFVAAGLVGLLCVGCWLVMVRVSRMGEEGERVTCLSNYWSDIRRCDTKKVGFFLQFLNTAAGMGNLLGEGQLLWRERSVNAARKIALGCSVAVAPVILLVDKTPVDMAIAPFSDAFFRQQSWSTFVMTLPTELVSGNAIGSEAGMVLSGGAMGAFFSG